MDKRMDNAKNTMKTETDKNLETLCDLFKAWCDQESLPNDKDLTDLLAMNNQGKLQLNKGQVAFLEAFSTVWEGFDQ